MQPLKIAGIGLYFPENRETKADFLKRGIKEDVIESLGIYERRIVGKGESASFMEEQAAVIAIRNAGLVPTEIDLIISSTILPEMIGIPNSNLLQHRIGAVNAAAFDVGLSCGATIPTFIIASNFIGSGQYKNILVTVSTNWSVISDTKQSSADFPLGDGAAAAVLTVSAAHYGIISFDMQTNGKFYYHCGIRSGNDNFSRYYDKHDKKLFFFIDNEGVNGSSSSFARYLLSNGPSAFKAALKKASLTPDDIDCAVIHGNVTPVVDGWIKGMKVPRERFPLTYSRYGNLSVVTLLANLKEGLDKGMIKHGSTVALVSQGAGFSAGCILMRWD